MKTALLSATILLLLFSQASWATLDFEDNAFPEFVTSSRALAMGNAYLCKVDDSMSAFYNPAGLGTVRGVQSHLANIHFEANSGLFDVIGNGPAYEIPGNYLDSFDPEKMRELLSENKGELAHSRVNLFPNFTVRGMTFGYMASQRNRAIINDIVPSNPNDPQNTFEIAERRDHGPVFSLSGSLFGGVVKLGASAVYLMRREINKSFAPDATVNVSTDDYMTGKGLQLTLGSRITLPVALLPTFSFVLRNATANDWESIGENGAPPEIEQTMDAGFSITPQIGKITRLHMEVNLKDLNNAYDTDTKRRLAAGVELDFNRRLFIRAGYGDGWGSGGLGVRTRSFQLDLTTYAVDRSFDGFREEEDRRWVFSIASGF